MYYKFHPFNIARLFWHHEVFSMIAKCIVVSLTLMLLSGCPITCYDCDGYNARPVYMTYEELRQSITVEPARAVDNISRIYLFNSYFFINDRNNGVHIFNNTDPSVPINEGFIKIPGNTELAIRNGFMYADSYVDLVTLNLNNLSNIRESSRVQDIFPWDANQNVPDSIYFAPDQLDKDRGVVVGYE